MQLRSRLLFILLMIGHIAFAQNGTVRGFVYEKKSGEPMSYVLVVLQGADLGVQTDVNGYFSIPQVKAGKYTLVTTTLGYDTSKVAVDVSPNEIVTQKLYLNTLPRTLSDATVTARSTEKITQVNAGTTTITPKEIKLLPSAGGEPDIAQYLQVVPGVVFTGDQGGQLYIRGGSPTQTGILLDGVTIYNPIHSIGLYSVFETDAIRNVDVQSAGFGAQYGNRTGAILDIRTKDGNKNRLAGKLSVSPIMARAMLEGPLVKSKKEGGGGVTFLLSAKHSYLESSSKSLYGSFGEPFKSGLPYSFTDLYGKVTVSGDNGSKLNLFGFNFNDQAKVLDPVTAAESAKFNWKASGGGATFVVTPGNSATLISGRFAYSKYDVDAREIGTVASSDTSRNSGIKGFEGAVEFTSFLPNYSQVKYGLEVSGLNTTLKYVNTAGISTELDRNNTSAALYAIYRKNFGEKLVIEPSLRVQYYSSLSKLSPEPRLGMKFNASPNVRFKAAAGLYSQNILSTRSDRDIVNFFNGFLLSPDETVKDMDGKEVNNTLQTAYHLIAGLEVDIRDVEFNLEPWYKNFTRNIELNRLKIEDNDPNFVAGLGNAYGVDLSAKYSKNRIFAYVSASVQKVNYTTLVAQTTTETPTKQQYAAPYDRRFNMNIVGSYTAGKRKDLELSLRYNLGSPFPFTQTQGFYENVNVVSGGVMTDYLQSNGSVGVLYANQLNGGRLSWYHRMDLSAKKRFEITEHNNIETSLAITNVYNRNNIFYIERTQNVRIYQLPIFPSINVTWNF
ncbi:MAG TPA: carboxypeptidase-like regulatory domain-containing protein [Flavipsychrobacter sp.]|nr:carboxypeptidase-like regulatory domain-containing protein [Flavipsychrobacter sp.]